MLCGGLGKAGRVDQRARQAPLVVLNKSEIRYRGKSGAWAQYRAANKGDMQADSRRDPTGSLKTLALNGLAPSVAGSRGRGLQTAQNDLAIIDDDQHVAHLADVVERVSLQDYQIGVEASADPTGVVIDVQASIPRRSSPRP